MPFTGMIVDRFGPRYVIVVSGVLVGLCWIIYSVAYTLPLMYFASIVGGIGQAGIYGGTIGNSLHWFGDLRGLAAGITAAGFGAGSALTIIPLNNMIERRGYRDTFLYWGLIQGVLIVIFGAFLRAPTKKEEDYYAPIEKSKQLLAELNLRERLNKKMKTIGLGMISQQEDNYTLLQVATQPLFWVFYVCFLFAAIPGLVATGQLAPFSKELGISSETLALALTVDRILNGVSRPISGFLSDFLGREELLFVAFLVEAFGFLFLYLYGTSPVAFVVVTGMLYFAYGEIFSLFPASLADTYGRRDTTAHYGLLYTAKGVASLLIPVTSEIHDMKGSWKPVMILCFTLGFTASLIIIFLG